MKDFFELMSKPIVAIPAVIAIVVVAVLLVKGISSSGSVNSHENGAAHSH